MERVYEVTFEVVVAITAESEQQAKDIACLDVTRGVFDEDAEFDRAEFVTIEEYTGEVPYSFKSMVDEPQAKDDIAMSLIDWGDRYGNERSRETWRCITDN